MPACIDQNVILGHIVYRKAQQEPMMSGSLLVSSRRVHSGGQELLLMPLMLGLFACGESKLTCQCGGLVPEAIASLRSSFQVGHQAQSDDMEVD